MAQVCGVHARPVPGTARCGHPPSMMPSRQSAGPGGRRLAPGAGGAGLQGSHEGLPHRIEGDPKAVVAHLASRAEGRAFSLYPPAACPKRTLLFLATSRKTRCPKIPPPPCLSAMFFPLTAISGAAHTLPLPPWDAPAARWRRGPRLDRPGALAGNVLLIIDCVAR
jgi:hypothetical protein